MNFCAFDINLFAIDIDFLAVIFLLKFRFVGSHFLLRQTMRGLTMRDRIRAHGATLKNICLDLNFQFATLKSKCKAER